MTMFNLPTRLIAVFACAAALTACSAIAPKAPTTVAAPKMSDMLAQASQASTGGNKEQAVKLWQQAAAAYPADKTPWASIAKTRYDAGQYGEAIVAAQEVLVRDPNDVQANSIIAISGLRLSTRSLAELSRQKNLSGDLRTESNDLAKLLRESLGVGNTATLVPSVATGPVKPKGPVTPGNKAAKPPKPDSGADPFSALKN